MISELRQAMHISEHPGGGKMGYRIERLNTTEDLEQIQMHWAQLAESIPNTPLFLTWEWGRSWWRHFGDQHTLYVLAAWDESGELAGLAPLMIVHERLGPLKIKRLTFLSNGVASPDHLDMLVRSGDDQVARAFLDYLTVEAGGWDVLDLNSLAPGSHFGTALASSNLRYHESSSKQSCPFIVFPDTWDEYLLNQLSQKRRYRVRKFAQRFENEFPQQVEFRRIEDPEEIPGVIRFISEMSRAYWESKGHASAFEQDRFEAFHNEMALAAHRQGWLRLYQMKVKDEIIACEYNFRHGDVFYGYQGVFDRKWADYSPGLVLLTHVFQEAIDEGVREFDFLKGDEEYKFYWTDKVRVESRLISARNWRGRLWLAAMRALDRGVGLARQTLSQKRREKVAKILSTLQRKKQPASD
jgi:CelD/BcsL family acetyltransferase involved in cellulose biosynthesis